MIVFQILGLGPGTIRSCEPISVVVKHTIVVQVRHVGRDVLVPSNGSFGYLPAFTITRHLCLFSFSSNPSLSARFSRSDFHYVRPHLCLTRDHLSSTATVHWSCPVVTFSVTSSWPARSERLFRINDLIRSFRRSRYTSLSVLPIPYAPFIPTAPPAPYTLITVTVLFSRMSAISLRNRPSFASVRWPEQRVRFRLYSDLDQFIQREIAHEPS